MAHKMSLTFKNIAVPTIWWRKCSNQTVFRQWPI